MSVTVEKSKQYSDEILLSAIVSVYNSERFIEGLMDDLLNQTLYNMGYAELIFINSGSKENEHDIIYPYLKTHKNITYIKTTERESIYQAWNRGVLNANGKYITNANADDRHKKEAFEVFVGTFEQNPDADIIYANSYQTTVENDTFESNTQKSLMKWTAFNEDLILFGCFLGPQPAWKKELHDKYGLFDENLKVVGDYEYWLRLSRDVNFLHISDVLGLYLYSDDSAEHRDNSLTGIENELVQKYYINRFVGSEEYINSLVEKQKLIYQHMKNDIYFNNAIQLLDYRREELEKEKYYINTPGNFEKYINDLSPASLVNVLEAIAEARNVDISQLRGIILQNKLSENFSDEITKTIKEIIMQPQNNNQEDVSKVLDDAIKLIEEHNYTSAKQKLNFVLEKEPENLDALNNLSVVEAFLNNYEASAKVIEKVMNIDPQNKIAHHNLEYLAETVDNDLSKTKLLNAEKLIEEKKYDEAEVILSGLLQEDEKNLDALNDLSVVHVCKRDYSKSVEIIQKILAIDPDNTTAKENLSSIEEMIEQELKLLKDQIGEINNEKDS